MSFVEFAKLQRSNIPTLANEAKVGYVLEQWQAFEANQLDPLIFRQSALGVPRSPRRSSVEEVRLGDKLSEAVRMYAKQAHLTPFMLCLTAFMVSLRQVSGQPRTAVWINLANREDPRTHRVIGMFANAQLIGLSIDEGMSWRDVIGAVGKLTRRAIQCQRVPMAFAIRHLPLQQARPALFVTFDFQNAEASDATIELDDGTLLQRLDFAARRSIAPPLGLEVTVLDERQGYRVVALYSERHIGSNAIREVLDSVRTNIIQITTAETAHPPFP
jgi:non-ribosomal peptide synthetase component F